jgi:hypothetical protein
MLSFQVGVWSLLAQVLGEDRGAVPGDDVMRHLKSSASWLQVAKRIVCLAQKALAREETRGAHGIENACRDDHRCPRSGRCVVE